MQLATQREIDGGLEMRTIEATTAQNDPAAATVAAPPGRREAASLRVRGAAEAARLCEPHPVADYFSFASSAFMQTDNMINILQATAVNGVLAIASTFVIITAGIDLSVGTLMTFCAVMAGVFLTYWGLPMWTGVIAAIRDRLCESAAASGLWSPSRDKPIYFEVDFAREVVEGFRITFHQTAISSPCARKPTMNEVASEAGVSLGTVSKVLNGNSTVAAELRARVLAACERLNYQRNRIAASLRSRQTNTIGVIVPDILNTFYAALVEKLENLASAAGYTLMVVTTGEDPRACA